jgi:hypothetical protein
LEPELVHDINKYKVPELKDTNKYKVPELKDTNKYKIQDTNKYIPKSKFDKDTYIDTFKHKYKEYENEKIVYDESTKLWILVKEYKTQK